MAFKPSKTFPRGAEYDTGKTTEDVAYDMEVERRKKEEEKIFGKERDTRIDLNKSIVELFMKNWPEEEIITSIARKFPEEGKRRIIGLVTYWKETIKTVKNKIKKIVKDVQNGLLNDKQAEEKIKNLCIHYNLLRTMIKDYFYEEVSQLGDEQR